MTKAYSEGRRAYQRGDALHDNPYQGEQWGNDDSRFAAWRDGWKDEQREIAPLCALRTSRFAHDAQGAGFARQ